MAQVNVPKPKLAPVRTKMNSMLDSYMRTAFVLLLAAAISWATPTSKAYANPLISAGMPGMVMAKMTFDINNPDDDRLLSPSQMRVKIMNGGGKDLIYVETPLSKLDLSARFAHGSRDKYKRPTSYPHNRDITIIDKPTSYPVALERYKRAVHIYKTSTTFRTKAQAKSYMTYCYKQALALYKRDMQRGGSVR